MTPTIEEVKKVADKHGMKSIEWDGITHFHATAEQLQAFAQHYIEVGRKMQRESDAKLCAEIVGNACNSGFASNFDCAEAIRNNTNEANSEVIGE